MKWKNIIGNNTWRFLHFYTYNLKDIYDINTFKRLILFIVKNYPCDECRKNFKPIFYQNILLFDNIKNKKDCIEYINKIHSIVNEKLKKDKYIGESNEKKDKRMENFTYNKNIDDSINEWMDKLYRYIMISPSSIHRISK